MLAHTVLVLMVYMVLMVQCQVSQLWSTNAPELVLVPPSSVFLSSGSDVVLRCAALGNPRPRLEWLDSSGALVTAVPGVR
ncbi:hypothetical protein HAZT_HAZT010265 [Hyalella azteca]|uniref:Ig-like domain-containing protein n=1 Tax=Hyalella azteca TaxID=294128 RepID=A0A6A0H1J0_HYAAZ|nr:hypothetical protein HAZT_HAZT010265 [Hyalella azteca]